MFPVLRSLPRLLAATAAATVLAVPALLVPPSAVAAPLRAGAPAVAAAAPSEDVTWMVRPSDGEREDGRSWIERELAPGDVVEEHLLIRNLSAQTIVFGLSAADGYFTENGRFNMLTADRESTDAGTWIDVEKTVEVASGADVVVPFTIAVPVNATPGDHPAGVAASIRTGEGEVGFESRVGFRVMTRVTGALVPAVGTSVGGRFEASWNPFEAGSLQADYTLSNDGNTRVSAAPRVTIGTLFGLVSRTIVGDPVTEMAPGESRKAVIDVPDLWPLFGYSVSVEPAAQVVPLDAPSAEVAAPSSSTTVIALPWSQLATLLMAALLVWWLIVDRRRRERRLQRLLDEARAQGATEPTPRPDADADASSRRGRRVAAGGALAVGLLALGTTVLVGPPPASADVAGSGSVRIEVDIASSPGPSLSPSPTPSPAVPSPGTSVSPAPGEPASPGASTDLPSTGAANPLPVLTVAVAFGLAGALALLLSRRRRSRGAGG